MKTRISLSLLTAAAALVLVVLLAPAHVARAFGAFVNFEGYAQGTPAEALAIPGMSMWSHPSPNFWIVTATQKYDTLSGYVLQNTACDSRLIIKLDSYYHTINVRFAVFGGIDRIKMQGWSGDPTSAASTMHFSNDYYGIKNSLTEDTYEGVATEDVQAIKYIVIYSLSGCVAIDDLHFDDRPVLQINPEIVLQTVPRLSLPEPRPTTLELPPIVIRGN